LAGIVIYGVGVCSRYSAWRWHLPACC